MSSPISTTTGPLAAFTSLARFEKNSQGFKILFFDPEVNVVKVGTNVEDVEAGSITNTELMNLVVVGAAGGIGL